MLIVETTNNPTHAIIWLHGLGADGYDFEHIVPLLKLPKALGIRFIFPNAPMRSITVNGGITMRGWFDIPSLRFTDKQDEQGILESQNLVEQLINEQKTKGIPAKNIFLAGFSQGGAVALHTGLRYPEPLAGILGLSTILMLPEKLAFEAKAANKDIPIFLAHGTQDFILPFAVGEQAQQALKILGYPVKWHVYTMGHTICDAEIADISKWLCVASECQTS